MEVERMAMMPRKVGERSRYVHVVSSWIGSLWIHRDRI